MQSNNKCCYCICFKTLNKSICRFSLNNKYILRLEIQLHAALRVARHLVDVASTICDVAYPPETVNGDLCEQHCSPKLQQYSQAVTLEEQNLDIMITNFKFLLNCFGYSKILIFMLITFNLNDF